MHGRVTDVKTGEPIAGATVDIWQASTNGKIVNVDSPGGKACAEYSTGLYEQQDPKQRDLNLRGQFVTDAQGKYSLYCLRPTPYPVSILRVPTSRISF